MDLHFKTVIGSGILLSSIVLAVLAMPTSAATYHQKAREASLPVQLVIPKAEVNARVIPVGVTATGHLDVPHNLVEAGWYQAGPQPGKLGSAVLDGHVDNGANTPGVFKHLRNLVIGDQITVTDDQGQKFTFAVIKKDVYAYTDSPGKEIFQQNGAAFLKLITCHGNWLPNKKTYDQRLVVTALLLEAVS